VAAFAVGALPQVIEDGVNGFLAPAGDLTGLADRVASWRGLDAGDRAAMGRAARATVESRFSRTAGVRATLACYARGRG
jgi:glycosyltransferase involved in cell wall biosynthesis